MADEEVCARTSRRATEAMEKTDRGASARSCSEGAHRSRQHRRSARRDPDRLPRRGDASQPARQPQRRRIARLIVINPPTTPSCISAEIEKRHPDLRPRPDSPASDGKLDALIAIPPLNEERRKQHGQAGARRTAEDHKRGRSRRAPDREALGLLKDLAGRGLAPGRTTASGPRRRCRT